MRPRDVFETHYRAADVLLRVYRLLESDDGPQRDHKLIPALREAIASPLQEDLILLLNQLFIGVVRERAELNLGFFRKESLDLLLRQSIVAACSALDISMPLLLRNYLPNVVRIRQRNFLPNDGTVKDLFSDFRLKLEDVWPLAEEVEADNRWDWITVRILNHCAAKTLSNEQGIAATLALLGVEKPWNRIAERAGERDTTLRDKVSKIVSRRNDIVHRADRARTDPEGLPQAIDFVWTQNHVGAVKTVVLACCDLVHERVDELTSAAPVAADGG